MRIKYFIYINLIIVFSTAKGHSQNVDNVYSLLQRLLPDRIEEFKFKIVDETINTDFFELSSKDSIVVIEGNSPLSIAYGLHYYLRNYCNASFSWNANNLPEKDKPLPQIKEKIRKESIFKYRYYLNYCTFNYSMSFWDWERWEREIDWMALHGINLPLALVGQEAVWQNTLKRLNYSEEEILKFIPGPTYTGWWLLGNLEGWGGPVSQNWIDEQSELQKKIVRRMKELGMNPVFQGFYGMVPNSLKMKYPNSKIHNPGTWLNFERPGFLLPEDSLFKHIAKIYYEEQASLYGTSTHYQGDPFHEGGISQGVDITQSAKGIYSVLDENSPGATWVLQAWGENPTPDLLKGIPKGKALVVDLYAEALPQWGGKESEWARKNSFEGHNWIWSEIPNFGGQTGMTAKLDRTNKDIMEAWKHPKGKEMLGIAATPEGIEQDPVIYDLLFDQGWSKEQINLDEWLKMYVESRYGKSNSDILEAWKILKNTTYNSKYRHASGEDGSPPLESVLCARPAWNINKVSAWGYGDLDYNPLELVKAWNKFVQNQEYFKHSDGYQFDIVNITRQVLANYGRVIYQKMQSAFEEKNRSEFEKWSAQFIQLIYDQDFLLSSRKEFLLGNWLNKAKQRAKGNDEMLDFELNARRLITTWTYTEHPVNDYAYREYSGLLKDYYSKRWEMYIDYCTELLNENHIAKPDFFNFEKLWTEETKNYPRSPVIDELEVTKLIWDKYYIKILNDTKDN